MRRSPTLLVWLLAATLCACGTRGALYLPPAQTKPATPPAPASTTTVADISTPEGPAQ